MTNRIQLEQMRIVWNELYDSLGKEALFDLLIESLTRNPKEYEPSYYTINHIMSEPKNFDNWKERIEEIKQLWECEWSTVGMSTHVRHDDVGWLLEFIDAQRKLIESYGRVTEGMTEDYQRLEKILEQQKEITIKEFTRATQLEKENKELNEFKASAEKLFQRQKLGFSKVSNDKELVREDLQRIIELANERCIDSQVIAELLKLKDKVV